MIIVKNTPKQPLPRLATFALIVLVFLAGLILGLYWGHSGVAASASLEGTTVIPTPDLSLINEAWQTIQRAYVDRAALNPRDLTYGAISGMIDALGDTGHSRFLTPDMVKEEDNFTQGKFQGIGAEVQMKDGALTIVAPIDNSPAQKAGLRPGDVIEKVNGQSIIDLPLYEVVHRLLGPAGTPVTLTILNPTTGIRREVTLIRAEITVQSVTWHQVPGTTIAHLRISGFSEGASKNLRQALTEIQQQHLTGIILDLRDNPGGLLNEAIDIVSQFLSSGNVLIEKNAQGHESPIPVKPGGLATKMPVVVLINGGTASAAEIVAGAFQDAHRATLIGDKTFGTGTVLEQFRLSDGSALLLATEEWLTRSGRLIWHHGISPDIEISLGSGATPLFPEAERDMTAQQFRATEDHQLLRATEKLADPKLPVDVTS